MLSAYVLIEVEPGLDKRVLEAVRKTEGVSEAYFIMGSYDIIAIIRNASKADLKSKVTKSIRQINGVRHTYTLPVISDSDSDKDSSA
ncbi:MAG: Lrp/AsnC ligand binding domain-containing protein [Nitrososphaerales archaeon]